LAGVGTGNFGKEIRERDLFSVESGAHNEFVRAAAEHGIMGILFYWGFYIIIAIEILSRKKEQRDMSIYLLVLYCLIIYTTVLKQRCNHT
jgi:O-antigen ligase